MTVEEFSNEFDTLLNSYAHAALFGGLSSLIDVNLDEYEKSVFLTEAQEAIIKELYSGKYSGDSFESSELLRRELDYLVSQKNYVDLDRNIESDNLTDNKYIHTIFNLPEDCLYIVYEQVLWSSENTCLDGKIADVTPVTHDEYIRTRNNPFRGPNTRRVLRLDKGDTKVELVSDSKIGKYIVRYIKKPEPIILLDLSNTDLTIDGYPSIDNTTPQTCKLSKSLHREILERAVRLSLSSRINLNSKNKGD